MNSPNNRLPLLRPQNLMSQQFSSTPTNQRFFVPRFGHSSIPSYPRPRSSASKPNPDSCLLDDSSYNYSNMDSMENNYGSPSERDSFSNGNSSLLRSPDSSAYFSCNESFVDSPRFPSPQKAGLYDIPNNFQNQAPVFQTQNRGRGNYRGANRGLSRKRKTEIIPFSAPFQKQKTSEWHCSLCSLDFTSKIPYDMHMNGIKHAKKLKSVNVSEEILKKAGESNDFAAVGNNFRCDLCNLTANSSLQFITHLEGSKHKAKVEAKQNAESRTKAKLDKMEKSNDDHTVPSTENTSEEPKPSKLAKYACDICGIIVNSDSQLQQHLSSKKHEAKVEGKPLPKKKKIVSEPAP